MNSKLNTGIIALSVALSVALSLISISVTAQSSQNKKYVPSNNYKCHVELIGGIQTIHFVSTKKQSLKEVTNSLVGKKRFKPFSREKLAIYKVFECVWLNDKFTSAQSKAVDEKTPR